MNNAWRNNKGKPLSLEEQINKEDGSLTIYRTEIGLGGKQGISFYGLSKAGTKCYQDHCPLYHKWILTSDIVDKIVDLHKPENRKEIETYMKDNKKNVELLNKLLFFGELPDNNSNRKKLSRTSEDSTEDREMAKILEKIFPKFKGSYTQVGPGLSHSEIIIWGEEINKDLHERKKYDHEIIGTKAHKRSSYNSPPPTKRRHINSNSPRTPPHGGGKGKRKKTIKLKKNKRKTKKRSHKHKK